MARVWNRALSYDEVKAVVEDGSAVSQGLVLDLRFDEEMQGDGAGPVQDHSGCGNHGFITGPACRVELEEGLPFAC